MPGIYTRVAIEKDSLQHQRIKHGKRNDVRRYVGVDATCIACGTNFIQRFKCIKHSTDKRRLRCRKKILANTIAPLDEGVVQLLDAENRALSRMAFKAGHSHLLAIGQAKCKYGQCVGRAMLS